jgi:DNA-binding response OmpR family regulator
MKWTAVDSAESLWSTMKILIVEDSAPTRDLLQRSLVEAGHSVVLASRLASGLRLATEGEFELAIVDVMLPDGSGLDLCREVRGRGLPLPILFLTARGEVEDRIAGLDAGGDDYLRKPFAIAELRARVRALGRRRGLAPPARLASGDTVIDFTARTVSRAGQQVTLTAREWAVLDVLATSAGRVVSREDVIAAAWPRPGPGASESLDVIVSRLRRKLGNEADPRIRTVRGQGFVLEVSS